VSRMMAVGVRGAFSAGCFEWSAKGSVIGPLLFLLYVNDLRDWIRNELKMFADDTELWSRIKTVADNTYLQQDLDSLCSWSDKW